MAPMEWNILHVTDFHINEPDEETELLRQGFYKEYIDYLVESVNKALKAQIHALIVTGDFVDRGKVANFGHVEAVTTYLAEKFGLQKNNIATCIGNHDITRSEDASGRASEARKAYRGMAQKFANRIAIATCDRALLCSPAKDIYCLMVDATLGSKGKDHPGTLETGERDQLMGFVDQVPQDGLLIVGTHYPLEKFPGSVVEREEKRWHQRHFWRQAITLRERIRRRRHSKEAVTLWLCGDTHYPAHLTVEEQHFVVTGRLGTRTSKQESQVSRQAKVITVSSDVNVPPKVLIAEYKLTGHKPQTEDGDWQCVESDIEVLRREQRPSRAAAPTITLEGDKDVVGTCLETIDINVEEEIMRTIRYRCLYRLGRFSTSGEEVSLSWVSMGPLMNEGTILPSLVKTMAACLQKKLASDEQEVWDNTVLLGLDCWGAVLASQISVLTGACNFCIAARGRGKYHTSPHEVVSPTVHDKIRDSRNVVLVTDVVATGQSLRWLYEEVAKGLDKDKLVQLRWLVLSVICDAQLDLNVDLSFLDAHGTACAQLRMPIVPSNSLPDEGILPPDISFT